MLTVGSLIASMVLLWMVPRCDITLISRTSTPSELAELLCVDVLEVDSATAKPDLLISSVKLFGRQGSVRVVRLDSGIHGVIWQWSQTDSLDSQDIRYDSLVRDIVEIYGQGETLGSTYATWFLNEGQLYAVKSSQKRLIVTWHPRWIEALDEE
jgi:hypothetical protein